MESLRFEGENEKKKKVSKKYTALGIQGKGAGSSSSERKILQRKAWK